MTPLDADHEKHKQFRLELPRKRTLSAKDRAMRTIPKEVLDRIRFEQQQKEMGLDDDPT